MTASNSSGISTGSLSAADKYYYDSFYLTLFCTALVTCFTRRTSIEACLRGRFGTSTENEDDLEAKTSNNLSLHRSLQVRYLIVYALMVAGDWLQGPYVYALYEAYGYERDMIAFLFVAGFGSSMLCGTFVGSLADRMGRKRLGMLYGLLYIGSCLTKHSSVVYWLLLGRILGGIATSLLMSVFESWLVCEHNKNGIDGSLLSDTFALQVFVNSLVAITSGVVAEEAADSSAFAKFSPSSTWFVGGYTAPFDVAIVVLLFGLGAMACLWSENYGDKDSSSSSTVPSSSQSSFREAVQIVLRDKTVLVLGLVQSLFEGAMYSFVFMWTPALSTSPPPPYGTIFSTFMICCMLGSQVFGVIVKWQEWTPERILIYVFAVSAAALSLGPLTSLYFGKAAVQRIQYLGFLVFEVCVGLYFPAMGTTKGKLVPEEYRSSIYNIFRIPLNVIVLIVLLGNFSVELTFVLCTLLLVAAMFLQLLIYARSKSLYIPLRSPT